MARFCTACHASTLPRSQRNGAPIYHDFDTLTGVLQVDGYGVYKTLAGKRSADAPLTLAQPADTLPVISQLADGSRSTGFTLVRP